MNIFTSFSTQDKWFIGKLRSSLNYHNIDIIAFDIRLKNVKKVFQMGQNILRDDTFVVLVLSKHFVFNFLKSSDKNECFSDDLKKINPHAVIVLIEDCEIPSYLEHLRCIDFRENWNEPLQELVDIIKTRENTSPIFENIRKSARRETFCVESHVKILREHLIAGKLSIFCGAGISIDAGLPSWPSMLKNLLIRLYEKTQSGNDVELSKYLFADFYQENFSHSPLMLAQYLKNSFGDNFIEEVRDELYSNEIKDSELINSIVELCRPNRFAKCLDSIVTFNFDDLIEEKLKQNKIKNKPISREGERFDVEEIPIFHVHGFLPRDRVLEKDVNLVFSEDAYHSQFIDSFSWSNLVQLIRLNQNLCLFIGLSLTDPNLRRILDVSMRKNPQKDSNHYFFKKRLDKSEAAIAIKNNGLESQNLDVGTFIDFIELLEEQDAHKLGLNVIWIDSYEEILEILKKVVK